MLVFHPAAESGRPVGEPPQLGLHAGLELRAVPADGHAGEAEGSPRIVVAERALLARVRQTQAKLLREPWTLTRERFRVRIPLADTASHGAHVASRRVILSRPQGR